MGGVTGVRYGALRRGVESMCRMLSNVWRNIPRPVQHARRSTKSTKDLWLNSSRLYSKCFAIILWTEYNWKGKEEYDNIKQLISKYFFAALSMVRSMGGCRCGESHQYLPWEPTTNFPPTDIGQMQEWSSWGGEYKILQQKVSEKMRGTRTKCSSTLSIW